MPSNTAESISTIRDYDREGLCVSREDGCLDFWTGADEEVLDRLQSEKSEDKKYESEKQLSALQSALPVLE
jgi:hypothetical protein